MSAPTFAELLDDAVRRLAAATAASERISWATRTTAAASTPFLYAPPLSAPVPRWPVEVARPPRRPHRLSADQARAFRGLLSLGGDLADDFSAWELRRVYRRLAHRYHPDRNTDRPDDQRALLARQFAELTECYRCLRPVVDPSH